MHDSFSHLGLVTWKAFFFLFFLFSFALGGGIITVFKKSYVLA